MWWMAQSYWNGSRVSEGNDMKERLKNREQRWLVLIR
jgi:hypothetical protein